MRAPAQAWSLYLLRWDVGSTSITGRVVLVAFVSKVSVPPTIRPHVTVLPSRGATEGLDFLSNRCRVPIECSRTPSRGASECFHYRETSSRIVIAADDARAKTWARCRTPLRSVPPLGLRLPLEQPRIQEYGRPPGTSPEAHLGNPVSHSCHVARNRPLIRETSLVNGLCLGRWRWRDSNPRPPEPQ